MWAALQGFYLPWYMLGVDLILGNPLKPDLLGMAAGHLYYFLTVLYPLSGGRFSLKTPHWVYPLYSFSQIVDEVLVFPISTNPHLDSKGFRNLIQIFQFTS